MADRCPIDFDESLISGYLDRELRQEDDQLVRIHIEDCAQCRAVFTELEKLREVTMSTKFNEPTDIQWKEAPTGNASLATRGLGWLMTIIWLLSFTVYGLWQLWTEPQSLMMRLFIFGGLSAFTLLFVSVVFDRLRVFKNDPYRGVKK